MSKAESEAFLDMLKTLNKMSFQLDDILKELRSIRSIIRSGESMSIQQIKASLLKSKLRSQIYELCDGNRTVSEITKVLGKPISLVSRYLKELEDAGLVLSEQGKKGRYYYKVV